MDHRLIVDLVPVKPNAAVKGEAHPLTAALEFAVRRLYVQVIRPSTVAGARADAVPSNTTHWRGVCACVARADHPPGVACTTVSVTPDDELKLLSATKLLV